MNNYELMKRAEKYDEDFDAIIEEENSVERAAEISETPAERFKNQIHYKTKISRRKKIMELERSISKIKLEEKIGNTYDAIVDGLSEDGQFYIARSYMDIPDEDGVIYIENNKKDLVGKFVKCRIIDTVDYDLIGKII